MGATTPDVTARWVAVIRSGDVHAFYTSAPWRSLCARVRTARHNECERCRSAGLYRPAEAVHHRRYLRSAPELALEESNLELLCAECHYAEHHGGAPLTPERW